MLGLARHGGARFANLVNGDVVGMGASAERRARIEREPSTALFGNAFNFPGMYLSRAWGAVDLGDPFRRPVTSDVPALLLVGDLDPRTPVDNAQEIAGTLSKARMVVLENATYQFELFGIPPIREILSSSCEGRHRSSTVSPCLCRRSSEHRPRKRRQTHDLRVRASQAAIA